MRTTRTVWREPESTDGQLRVLLISPVPQLDPPSGDVTYTRQLLAAPPPGVLYTTYDQAIEDGTLTEAGTRRALQQAEGRERVRQLLVAGARKFEHVLRRSGLAYREQIRVFQVDRDAFDLVHVHVFHHRFLGATPPVIASAGGPLRWVYADAWGWSTTRIAVAEGIDQVLGALWDATLCGSRLGRAQAFIAPSQYLRQWLLRRGWPDHRIVVQPNYLVAQPRAAGDPSDRRSPQRLGFIARDFDAKGGADVIAAHRSLRQTHPGLQLLIVGSEPRLTLEEMADLQIEWLAEVPREELLQRILPTLDVLVYPSRFDTGVPYSAMEALAEGVPAVVSDYRSLPDLVGPDAGRVARVGDVPALASSVAELLDPTEWQRSRRAARSRFDRVFSSTTQASRLGGIYRRLLRHDRLADGRSGTEPVLEPEEGSFDPAVRERGDDNSEAESKAQIDHQR